MSFFLEEIYLPEITPTIIDDTVTQKIESFEDDGISLEVIAHARGVYQFCYNAGFDIEVYPNDDNTISLLAMYENHSLEFEIGESEFLSTRYQIGKGLDFEVIWRTKQINQSEVSGILSQIRQECEQSSLSETLISTSSIDQESNHSDLAKSLNTIKEVYQSSFKNVLTTLGNSQHYAGT